VRRLTIRSQGPEVVASLHRVLLVAAEVFMAMEQKATRAGEELRKMGEDGTVGSKTQAPDHEEGVSEAASSADGTTLVGRENQDWRLVIHNVVADVEPDADAEDEFVFEEEDAEVGLRVVVHDGPLLL
jgi:hypothetical protein